MNILFVGVNSKFIHTNLAIRYLYTYLKEEFTVDFKEFTIKDEKKLVTKQILNQNPTHVGFSSYIWNIEYISEVVIQLKKQNPDIKILLGGPEVSYDARHWFSILPIDYLIYGEGELATKRLFRSLRDDLALGDIPQVAYRKNNEVYINNREESVDFSALPTPYRLKRDLSQLKNRIQYIETSRGCPFKCSYCMASLENNVRHFKNETVKNEIRFLMEHGAKVFKFLDRTFNIRYDYALDMFKFIIEEHYPGTQFQFEITGDILDPKIIHYLNEHAPQNLIRFEIGIQSTNELTNQLILRKQNLEKLTQNIKMIQDGGKIDLHLDLIAGLPKETYHSFQKTFNDVFCLRPHELQLGFLKMLRGTKIRNEAELYHYVYDEHAPYEIIKHEDISEHEIHKIHLAEEMVEKFWNTHRFDRAMKYIIDTHFDEAYYEFFEQLGIFYDEHYSQIGYQLHDLCTRLLSFWNAFNYTNTRELTSLVIVDYLTYHKTRPKKWYDDTITEFDSSLSKNKLIRSLLEQNLVNIQSNILYKYAQLEILHIHPDTYEKGTYIFVKLYHPDHNQYLTIDYNKLSC